MKKLVLTCLVTFSAATVVALPLGNPAEPALMRDGLIWEGLCADFCDPCVAWYDAISFRVGFYGDYVFNRHLVIRGGARSGSLIEDSEIFTNAGYLAVNLFDYVDIFTNLGVSTFDFTTNLSNFVPLSATGVRLGLESVPQFSWGVGARAILFQCGCTTLGIEGQYFRFEPRIRRIRISDAAMAYPDDNGRFIYEEWQVGIGISYRIWDLVPYLGAKWSHAEAHRFRTATTLTSIEATRLRQRFHGGAVLGVSFVDCEKATITAEFRWPDEKALYINGQIRF